MRLPALLIVAAVWRLTHVAADVQFTTPSAGQSFVGGSPITVSWKETGDEPLISEISTVVIELACGSNDNQYTLTVLGIPGIPIPPTGKLSIPAGIPATVGGNGVNVYFLRMRSTLTGGGLVINYSDRFTMTGMTGVFSTAQESANALGDTTPPDRQWSGDQAVVPGAGPQESYSVAYSLQTGATRYAPMQQQPGTKITAKNASPQYPTSSFTIFTAPAAPAKVPVTTLTEAWTYPVTTLVNQASPAPMPDEDMQKFLNRWKD